MMIACEPCSKWIGQLVASSIFIACSSFVVVSFAVEVFDTNAVFSFHI